MRQSVEAVLVALQSEKGLLQLVEGDHSEQNEDVDDDVEQEGTLPTMSGFVQVVRDYAGLSFSRDEMIDAVSREYVESCGVSLSYRTVLWGMLVVLTAEKYSMDTLADYFDLSEKIEEYLDGIDTRHRDFDIGDMDRGYELYTIASLLRFVEEERRGVLVHAFIAYYTSEYFKDNFPE